MTFTRRFFLRGLGATVAIPILPSLLTPREARAQAVANSKRFVLFGTNHGGVWAEHMFPSVPGTGVETMDYAGISISRFPLSATRSNGMASISPVLTAPDADLPDSLIQKMFSIQGLDVPFYLGHHTGGYLGNYARNDGNGGDGEMAQADAERMTIDQIMAWSDSFYTPGSFRERALLMSDRMSYNWSSPMSRTGSIQEIGAMTNQPGRLFDQLFPTTMMNPRPPVIDRVLKAYQRLRASPRISQADRFRLDDHIQRVHELERRVNTRIDCSAALPPTGQLADVPMGWVRYNQPYANDPTLHGEYFKTLNDVFVTALSCGISRIAITRISPLFSDFIGDWHQDVAHQANQPDGARQQLLWESHQRIFADVIVDLARKMDAVDMGDGKTLLDLSLIAWEQESGNHTHNNQSMPVIGFGSADGALQTGYHHDYRDQTKVFDPSDNELRYPGLLWPQWLGQVLSAMGIPRSEWENPSVNGGYPDYNFAQVNWVPLSTEEAYPTSVWNVTGEPLPWLGS